MDSAQSLLSLSNLTLTRNSVAVVTDGHLAGKTTLAELLAGASSCTVSSGSVMLRDKSFCESVSLERDDVCKKNNVGASASAEQLVLCIKKDFLTLTPAERARQGLYVAFQNVPEFDGVTAENFLYEAYAACHGRRPLRDDFRTKLNELCCVVGLSTTHLERPLFKGFSGGERKRFQLLELLLLRPRLAVLDELDAGLDAEGLHLFLKIIQALCTKNSTLKFLRKKSEDEQSEKYVHEYGAHEYGAHEYGAHEYGVCEDQEREHFLSNYFTNNFYKKTLAQEYECSFLIITHNQSVIDALAPDRVYELADCTLREIVERTSKGKVS